MIVKLAFSTTSSLPCCSVFQIPGTITDEDAVDAYNFLANEWLIDVAADAQGKAVAIAAALTMIQTHRARSEARFLHRRGAEGRRENHARVDDHDGGLGTPAGGCDLGEQ